MLGLFCAIGLLSLGAVVCLIVMVILSKAIKRNEKTMRQAKYLYLKQLNGESVEEEIMQDEYTDLRKDLEKFERKHPRL